MDSKNGRLALLKAVIFDGSKDGDLVINKIEAELKEQLSKVGWEVEILELSKLKIAECTSCFGCWIRTPGICAINDDGRETTKKYVQSDLAIWISPVTFGGYSYELKKALDRIIPSIMPYFEPYRGQIHHGARYKKYPKLLVIGVQEPGSKNEETFLALAQRNALNFRPPATASGVFNRDQNQELISAFVAEKLEMLEVKS
jgi:multimeric flavodoxin WrbA